MKNFIIWVIVAVMGGCAVNVSAQAKKSGATKPVVATKPYKGEFQSASTAGAYVYGNINLYEPDIEGTPAMMWDSAIGALAACEGPVGTYGIIENREPGASQTYYIVKVESLDTLAPAIWLYGKGWPAGNEPVIVGINSAHNGGTITMSDWMGGDYFDNVRLTRKK